MEAAKVGGAAQAMEAVVTLLTEAGFEADGTTRRESVRVATRASPVYGCSGGEVATFGGRARYAKRGGDLRATVGKRTTCIYRVADAVVVSSKTLDTKDIEGVRAAMTEMLL